MNPIAYLMTAIVAVALGACGNGEKTPLHAQADCADWNTEAFYVPATVSDVTRCLEAGADPNARDEWGATPLHYMAQLDGFAEAIEALASAGADLEARNEWGKTPLHTARTGEGVTALLEAGANPNARDEGGQTPLHTARTGEGVTALLEAGVDLNARDEGGRTPLYRAAGSGNTEAIEALAAAGANLEARGGELDMTPAVLGGVLWECRSHRSAAGSRGEPDSTESLWPNYAA